MRPNFSGTWRLDLARSVLKVPGVAGMMMRIAHADPEFTQAVHSVAPDGSVSLGQLAGRTDGAEFRFNMQGRYPTRSHTAWQGHELVIESWVQAGGELYMRDCWSLANPDELHMIHRDDALAGQIAILTRVPDTQWPS